MIKRIYCDNHWGSPIALPTWEKFRSDYLSMSPFVVSLGDNNDLVNCAKEDILKLKRKRAEALFYLGPNYIDGNHEAISTENRVVRITDDIIGVHGDFEAWGTEKAVKFRTKSHGASALKRSFVVKANEFYDKFINSKYDEEFLVRCHDTCMRHDAKVIVMGHRHPSEVKRFEYCGVKIIVLPRGINEFNTKTLSVANYKE